MGISEKQAYEMGLIPKPKGSKYKNKKTPCTSGHLHRSRKEAAYCCGLLLQQKNGLIKSYVTESPYILQEGFTTDCGEKVKPIIYVADFVVHRNDDRIEIVDVKGFRTSVFNLKWKMLKHLLNGLDYIFTIV